MTKFRHIKVTFISGHGGWQLSADPTGWLYLAITLPLMLATLILWILWQCYDRRFNRLKKVKTPAEKVRQAWHADIEMGVL